MIVIKIELHSANSGSVTEIGRMLICNDGTGTNTKGNYDVKLGRKGCISNLSIYQKPQRESHVAGYNRISSSVWNLVAKALKSLDFK